MPGRVGRGRRRSGTVVVAGGAVGGLASGPVARGAVGGGAIGCGAGVALAALLGGAGRRLGAGDALCLEAGLALLLERHAGAAQRGELRW